MFCILIVGMVSRFQCFQLGKVHQNMYLKCMHLIVNKLFLNTLDIKKTKQKKPLSQDRGSHMKPYPMYISVGDIGPIYMGIYAHT